MRLLLIISVILSLTGCSARYFSPDWPWPSGKTPCADSAGIAQACNEQNVLDTYSVARGYCLALADYYEGSGNAINSGRFGIATLGTLAGAVFSPVAGGTAKTAWSGLSGSTNALQASLDQNFSNAVNVRRRQEIAGAGKSSRREMSDATTDLRKVLAAIDIAYECRMAIGIADAAAIKAINDLQQGKDTRNEEPKPAAVDKPTQTTSEAHDNAIKQGTSAGLAAALATIPDNATPADKAVISKIGETVALDTAARVAPAAAEAAVQTARLSSEASATQPGRDQIQAAAQAAAQIAARNAVTFSATQVGEAATPHGTAPALRQAIMSATTAAATAAVDAAAKAAAATAAAPGSAETAQPIELK